MQIVCQWIILVLLIAGLITELYRDVNGRSARAPLGFTGVMETIIITALVVLLYFKAGAFSLIVK